MKPLELIHPKIQSLEAFCKRARVHPRPLVFTNGCFDILHAGHVHLLRRARAHGDMLVIGLNSDASITRLKGSSRPVTPLEQRAYVLAGLECVDAVIAFEEDTPLELIKAIQPDVLIKGGDWTKDRIVGAAEVASWGGEVFSLDLLPGFSTTAIVERILRLAALD
ncbi:D-glycero-beta-D-manno-heptose 1-phosphate adenylyltransferase [Desulfonatronum sp. SC1]|uniref:D-glycero-beta-D-manno-heptose 1-phosphate adenylyltransferase n=1 Tax=Desulfonatronum sp. SC1 TaxID=2109626 RepID=UPI000D31F82D|nr:D-glycero-beta-D-manno-heptose 1-phosphate adenylyltransferase [Desulfonatronum sp. SC1]PTN37679.1 D-glycero-beta-D-manno-heptose 1-phosphate adenylyltransferase [Desulfonatronum sp. SC1]